RPVRHARRHAPRHRADRRRGGWRSARTTARPVAATGPGEDGVSPPGARRSAAGSPDRVCRAGAACRLGGVSRRPPGGWNQAGVRTGARRPPHWSGGAKVPDMEIWDLKHHFELALRVAAPACDVQPATGGAVGWVAVQRGGEVVGWAGPLEADAPVWAAALL